MARTPQPDVDAIADDPTVLLERPGDDAFASVALPRPAQEVPRPVAVPPPVVAAPVTSAPSVRTEPVSQATAEPSAAAPPKARKRRRPTDKLVLSAIVVALISAVGAGWIIAQLLRG